MKLNKYLMLIAASALTLTACDDYLDVPSENTLTTDSFWGSPAQLEQGLNGVYHDLIPAAYHMYYLGELPSDNNYFEWDTERTWDRLAAHDGNIQNLDELNNAWVDYFKCIAHANTFIENADRVSGFKDEVNGVSAIRNQMIGEAYFIRAISYFELVQAFGRIPVFTKTLSNAEAVDPAVGGQQEPKVAYDQVVEDLKTAESLLNNAPTDYRGNAVAGKPTQISAKAMLGRVYLTMATHPDYKGGDSFKQQAASKLKEVLDYVGASGTPTKYWAKTAEEWGSMFLHENDNKYYIFELQYATDAAKTLGNKAIFEMQPEVRNGKFYPVRIFGNKIFVMNDLLEAYGHPKDENGNWVSSYGNGTGNADMRADWTVCYLSGSDLVNDQTGSGYSGNPFYTKFLETTPKRVHYGKTALPLVYDDYYKDEINFPVIRLEDVMLMYCEIQGCNAETLHLYNLIHGRATGNELSQAEASANWDALIKLERRLEFAQEGIRWHDMVRRGETLEKKTLLQTYSTGFASQAVGVYTDYYRFAIPQNQINVKDGLYTQNPEYK